ncbi:hypothetical protein JM93_03853 [Roseibium hamelinense]|uniref:Uncharacterized protein n=1 Tax=Roseibium hamelinense TaxID=150831 RepID=A0A562SKQ8_9HYPH|nr:hypothetical protein [Roseibium hamelinense]TWI81891.1 hypothetical protein JM93_03853 [Roseibium hamelinense]
MAMLSRVSPGLATVLLLWSGAAAVSGQEAESVYTTIELPTCVQAGVPDGETTFGGSWLCRGHDGIPVYIVEGDLRMFVSFGNNAANEPSAGQTLPNFNSINDRLEWRMRFGIPFATILRWFPSLDDTGRTGSVLIVTQLEPGATCQIARVDAQANSDANVLARQAADLLAGTFDCANQPQVIGNPGIFRY